MFWPSPKNWKVVPQFKICSFDKVEKQIFSLAGGRCVVTTGGSHMRKLQRKGENIFVIEAKKCVNYATPVRPAGGCGCLVVARRSRYYLFIDNAAKILQQTEHSSRQQPAPVTFKLIIQGQIIAGERCRSQASQMPIVSQRIIQL